MRVNPNITADLLSALSNAEQEENTAMLQMASGRRVSKPSDDPTAAAMLVQNHSESSQADQFLSSISSVQSQLQTADSSLNSTVVALQQAISLGVEGSDGTLSDSDRASLVNELNGIQSQLISLANTSLEGKYIFAGTAVQTQPFVADSTTGARYAGNTGVNTVDVGEGLSSQINLPGSQIFSSAGADVFQSMQDLITALQNNSGVDAAVTNLRTAFDHVTSQRVFYGNALNQLSSQQNYLNDQKLQLSSRENTLGGTDLAEATTRLLNAENARTAALEATGRIWQSTLFDYLK